MGLLQMPRMMLPVCTWPQARQETLRESDRVCLHGLSYKPELNQREGTVLAQQSACPVDDMSLILKTL